MNSNCLNKNKYSRHLFLLLSTFHSLPKVVPPGLESRAPKAQKKVIPTIVPIYSIGPTLLIPRSLDILSLSNIYSVPMRTFLLNAHPWCIPGCELMCKNMSSSHLYSFCPLISGPSATGNNFVILTPSKPFFILKTFGVFTFQPQ